MARNDDILVKLFRYAHRQSENFTTEAFAHVLQHLVEYHPVRAARLLTWLVAPRIELAPADLEDMAIDTQRWTENREHGVPDVRLRGPDFDIIIEVKLDDSLGAEQSDAYLKELARSARPRRALVGLTGRPPQARLSEEVLLRLWRDVGSQLQTLHDEIGSDANRDVVTEREVSQFLCLLGHQRLLQAPRVDSPIADAIEQHRQQAEKEPTRASLFNSRVRRIEALDGWDGLGPLRALLLQVREALEERGHGVRLESGQSGSWPWIGYTIDNLAYFVEVNLDEPRYLTITRWAGGVSPSSFDGTLGELEVERGRHRWSNDFDLGERGYFAADERGQAALLREFLAASFQYASRLAPEAGEAG